MAELDIPAAPRIPLGGVAIFRLQRLISLAIGGAGGALASVLLATSLVQGVILGALFGLAFSFFFSRRATTPGAGFIWGVAAALLVWIVGPAGILAMRYGAHPMGMLSDARAKFPQLVAFLICLGMPVGITVGTWGLLDSRRPQTKFSWGRAIVAGGLAGLLAGFIFGQWVSSGNYFPLLAGYGEPGSRTAAAVLHSAIALLIGATFGVLFQRDVRGYGSSMAWGLASGIFWWFLGPLTLSRVAGRLPLDWSADRAGTCLVRW